MSRSELERPLSYSAKQEKTQDQWMAGCTASQPFPTDASRSSASASYDTSTVSSSNRHSSPTKSTNSATTPSNFEQNSNSAETATATGKQRTGSGACKAVFGDIITSDNVKHYLHGLRIEGIPSCCINIIQKTLPVKDQSRANIHRKLTKHRLAISHHTMWMKMYARADSWNKTKDHFFECEHPECRAKFITEDLLTIHHDREHRRIAPLPSRASNLKPVSESITENLRTIYQDSEHRKIAPLPSRASHSKPVNETRSVIQQGTLISAQSESDCWDAFLAEVAAIPLPVRSHAAVPSPPTPISAPKLTPVNGPSTSVPVNTPTRSNPSTKIARGMTGLTPHQLKPMAPPPPPRRPEIDQSRPYIMPDGSQVPWPVRPCKDASLRVDTLVAGIVRICDRSSAGRSG
ncbi:uncharacterized protein STEHIDRAFT_157730 [Stereum hirsutum FP-91666 SS1]|uniref:uncharacterized protein n=1 Tax=Stereum hirsutum (strain FP-91666) TaxID=721885 RepID=UPI000444A905|nr:uncharacterized protein STEHIDRAFT_157730 [Stereum hirsutum FP-91666 SS1]EIM86226.1 hypothetical protein STEHIDRAFT_157730 [Stereum hirsutum FP-91666 SS1]